MIVSGQTQTKTYTTDATEGTHTHTTKLVVTDSTGATAIVRKDITVQWTETSVAPSANFSATPLNGAAPLSVQFTNQTTGTAPITYAWDYYNDGVTDSTQTNPSVVLSTPGVYSIKLTATNPAGTNSIVKTSYITVTDIPSGNILYAASPPSGSGLTAVVAGSSSDQGSRIQACLDYALPHGYTTVAMPAGATIWNSLRLIIPAGITMDGQNCLIRKVAGSQQADYQTLNIYGTCRNTRWQGTTNGTTRDSACGLYLFSGGTLDSCEVFNFSAYSVSVFAAVGIHDCTITNNYIHDSFQYGICLGVGDPPVGNTGHICSGNRVESCGEVGIKCRGVNSAEITDNTVLVDAWTTDTPVGIRLYSDDGANYNVLIDNNTITGIGSGIGISSDGGGDYNITITNNTITNMGSSFALSTISGLVKSGNICNGTPCEGSTAKILYLNSPPSGSGLTALVNSTSLDQTTALKNGWAYALANGYDEVHLPSNAMIRINNNSGFPMRWNGYSNYTTRRITLVGNNATLYLIAVTGVGGASLSWNICEPGVDMKNVTFDGGWGTPNHSLAWLCMMCKGWEKFTNVTMKNIGGYGFMVYPGSVPAQNIEWDGCTVEHATQYGITTGCSGCSSDSSNIIVRNCTIKNCREVGIKIRMTDGALIENNNITLGLRRRGDADGGVTLGDVVSGIRLYSADGSNNNIIIGDNTILGLGESDSTGIDSDSEGSNTNITIEYNAVNNCGTGIDTGGIDGGTNVIQGNTCNGVPCPGGTPANTLNIGSLGTYGLSPLTYSGDEASKLQAALDYAKANGYTNISFPSGKTINIGSRVRFRAGTTTIGNNCIIKRTSSFDGAVVVEGATVRGLIIDGGTSAANRDNMNGVYLWSNSVFDGNEVRFFSSYSLGCVQSGGTHDVKILNNYVHDSCQYGINTGAGDLSYSEYCYNITVSGNTISRCGEVGIKFRGTRNSIASGNHVTIPDAPSLPWTEYMDFTRGISLYSLDAGTDNIIIENNTIVGSVGQGIGTCSGIDVDDGGTNTNITIRNNTISNCDTCINASNMHRNEYRETPATKDSRDTVENGAPAPFSVSTASCTCQMQD